MTCFFLAWEKLPFQRHTTSAHPTICAGAPQAQKWSQWRVIKGLAARDIVHFWTKEWVLPPLLLRHRKEQLHTLGSPSKYTSLKAQILSLHLEFFLISLLITHTGSVNPFSTHFLFWHPLDGECQCLYGQSKSDRAAKHQIQHLKVYPESLHNIVHGWVEAITCLYVSSGPCPSARLIILFFLE